MQECLFNIDDVFSVITAQGSEKFLSVVYTEMLAPSDDLIQDFGELASGASDNANKITKMELEGSAKTSSDLSEVGQWYMSVISDCCVTVKLPAAQSKFKTRNDEIRIDHNSGEVGFFTYEDDVPYFSIYNPTQYTLAATRVAYWGYRIVGRQITEKQAVALNNGKKPRTVSATGFSR